MQRKYTSPFLFSKYSYILLGISVVFFGYLMGAGFVVHAQEGDTDLWGTQQIDWRAELVSSLMGNLKTKDSSPSGKMKELISTFCNTTKKTKTFYEASSSMVYDAHQSLFLALLCEREDPDTIDKSYANMFIYEEDGKGKRRKVNRLLRGDLYENPSEFSQSIFDSLMGTYTNIKQAQIYGAKNDEKTPLEKLANTFSASHFPEASLSPSNSLPNTPKGIEICANDVSRSYPKTCKKIKEYIRVARGFLKDKNNVLDPKELYTKYAKDVEGQTLCLSTGALYDVISCGLFSNMGSFSNLVYNEYLWYDLFGRYLVQAYNIDPSLASNSSSITSRYEDQKEAIYAMEDVLGQSQATVSLTIHSLKELQSSFPIHIGLFMYAEDVYRFGEQFIKLLTPFYTLTDILKNVQVDP